MPVVALSMRDFRGYESATVAFGPGLTVVWGPNGAGKTNLLEAVYFGCTGRSCRTGNDREVVRFGTRTARVVVSSTGAHGDHEFTVGFSPGEPKRMTADGAKVERLLDAPDRPLVSVFLPDRLELIKGMPAVRRAHLDQFVSALWPSRTLTRRAYAQTLAQRNALIGRLRAGYGSRAALSTWDAQLARHAIALTSDRREAIALVTTRFGELGRHLGLVEELQLEYRSRSPAASVDELVHELGERWESDIERGFSGHGPHRDDFVIKHGGHELRVFGSQGQQRIGLLALLLSEREAIGDVRPDRPLMLLDDVMSELDAARRSALVDVLRHGGGQVVITATDLDHVPGAGDPGTTRIGVSSGRLLQEAQAA